MSNIQTAISEPVIESVKDCVHGFSLRSKDLTNLEVRSLAAWISKVDAFGIGGQLMASTIQNAAHPETDSISNLNSYIKAVLYRILFQDGEYSAGGELLSDGTHAPCGEYYREPTTAKQAASTWSSQAQSADELKLAHAA